MKAIIHFSSCTLAIFCSAFIVQAQNKKAQQAFEKGEEYYAFGKYDEAITNYKLAIELDNTYLNPKIRLGEIYEYNKQDYKKAVEQFEAIMTIDSSMNASFLEAAKCYLYLMDYAKGMPLAEKYAKVSANTKREAEANLLLASFQFAKKAIQNPVDFKPVNLGSNINSEKSEYFPAITADNESLYFTVNNPSSKYPDEDIYVSNFENEKWQARKAVKSINKTNSQEGAHSVTQDGRYIFFASDRREGNQGRFDIYVSKKVGNEWQEAKNLGNPINSHNWESQPVISANSKMLFIVRKSKDGYGGSDIYISHLQENGSFSEPQNIGANINTFGDEQRPYFHPDGKTLYFSSNGHPGFGKGDIYKSILQDDNTWSKPINLGYPINSPEMEFGLYVSADGETGYFSSEKTGGFGSMDIYSFAMPVSAQPEKVIRIKGKIIDEVNGKPIKADIKIVNLNTNSLYKTLSSDAINGSYLITLPANQEYMYQANAEGYLPYSENFSLKNIATDKVFELEAKMKKIAMGNEFILKNIFFDEGEYKLMPSSQQELNSLVSFLNAYPNVHIEIGGHTDDVGSEADNQILSENRAKAVLNYLVEHGIGNSRLSFKGYGESKPLVPNTTESNKAINRRTAFKIL